MVRFTFITIDYDPSILAIEADRVLALYNTVFETKEGVRLIVSHVSSEMYS